MPKSREGSFEENSRAKENITDKMRQEREDDFNAEKIKIIEQIKMGSDQLADTILVILDLKPATELNIYNWNEDPKEIKRKMEEAGLIVEEKKIPDQKKKKLSAVFAISRDSSNINKLLNAEADNDHAEYGRLMGYPETAVQAFLDESKLLPDGEYPDMNGVVFQFKMSKDNHDTELEVLKRWSEAIKKYAPDLYKKLI